MKTTTPKLTLPPGTIDEDFVRPERKYAKTSPFKLKNAKDVEDSELGNYGKLTLHHTSFGWVIATLPIRRSRNAAYVDRTYGVRVDNGSVVRVGSGPHVAQTVTLYLRPSRMKVLQPLLDLWLKGIGRASEIRDRISTRRAQGDLHRAAGHHSWRWSDPI